MDLIKKWEKVKAAKAKQYQDMWADGATEEELDKLRKEFGDTLPETLYGFLKVNNGSDGLGNPKKIL